MTEYNGTNVSLLRVASLERRVEKLEAEMKTFREAYQEENKIIERMCKALTDNINNMRQENRRKEIIKINEKRN